MLTLGEVHTGLLQHSTPLSLGESAKILDQLVGERVRQSERPTAYAVSPDRLTGVDCHLASAKGGRIRAVGTVISRATITGGHVLQGSSYTSVGAVPAARRLPWSHYLSRPGRVETVGLADEADLAAGFGHATLPRQSLDLAAISSRAMDSVQTSSLLDRTGPLKTRRTTLRWVASTSENENADTTVEFAIESRTLRTLTLNLANTAPATVAALCEDLALHDWLLTTLLSLIDGSLTGPGTPAEKLAKVRPAIDHLLHLWMPGARVDSSVLAVWESMERRPGFTRQWQASVNRIRDHVTMAAITLLGEVAGERVRA
jgi:hypothetical protein